MIPNDITTLEPKKNIIIKGAQVHNLKNLDVAIPRNKLVVITGLSGSGKSSLAFDTLYAEGQRRYVESLSSYARQFLGRLDKPKVEYIKGIAPAIAIEQKVNTTNARSTVGTSTEIYDYLKLLFARIGKTYSPVSGQEVKKNTVTDVINTVKTFALDSKWLLLAPIHLEEGRKLEDKLKTLLQQGFARILVDGETVRVGIRSLPVAGGDVRPADDDFAHLTRRDILKRLVHHAHAGMWQRFAHRVRLFQRAYFVDQEHRRAGFGHTKSQLHYNPPRRVLLQQRRGHR